MLPRRNVLIFHSGALGDFILTWPLALAVGRLFPQSRIFYLTQGQKGALAEKVLRVESVDVEGGWHHLFADSANPPALPAPAAKLLGGAHYVFSYVADGGSAWERNVRAVAPAAQVVSLSQLPPAEYPGHHTDFLLEQLRPFPAIEEAVRQILRSIAQRGVTASPVTRGDGPVVLHPGSGSREKCWPPERFLELARRLQGAGRGVRVIMGEVEAEWWQPRDVDAFAAVGELRRPDTLLGLLDSLTGASGFVGNDSGPGHLAGVMGLPTVCVFGPTDPASWRPLGPRVHTLRRVPLDALPAAEVYDTVTGLL